MNHKSGFESIVGECTDERNWSKSHRQSQCIVVNLCRAGPSEFTCLYHFNRAFAESNRVWPHGDYHKVNRVLRWFYIQHTFSPSICVHCDTGSGVISQSSELAASSSIFINVDFPVAEIICQRLMVQSVRSLPIFPSMLILTGVLRGLFVKAIWSIVTYLNTYHLLSVLLHLYSTESLSTIFSYLCSKKMKKEKLNWN